MKKIYKYLSLFLSIFLIIILTCGNIKVNASFTQNQFHATTQVIGGVSLNCFEYDDPSLLPSTKQVYWVENQKVYHENITAVFTVIMNKKFGLAIKPSFLSNYFTWLNSTLFGGNITVLVDYFNGSAGFVYNGSEIVGIALSNLDGFSLNTA